MLLRILTCELPRKSPFLVPLLAEARRLLALIRQSHQNAAISRPPEGSPALLAFDSRIARQLNSIMPVRSIELPKEDETWRCLEGLLDGWTQVSVLVGCESILAWNVSIHDFSAKVKVV